MNAFRIKTMKITLLCLGNLDLPYLKEGIQYYEKKLKHYTKLEIIELSLNKNKQPKEHEAIKIAEGELILSKVTDTDLLILFDEKGKSFNSIEWSKWFEEKLNYHRGNIVFVIGGAFGFSQDVYKRADQLITFSSFTFNHQLFRIIVLEQFYRIFTIIKGEPYHHK